MSGINLGLLWTSWRRIVMNRLLWTLALVVLLGGQLAANPPAPPPKPPVKEPAAAAVPMNVVIDDKATEPKLVIPKKVLATLKADAGDPDPDTRRVEHLHLIVAGCALTLALTFGGLWLVRGRRKPGSTALLVLVALGGVVAVTSMVWANAGPPRLPAPPGIPLADKVTIETSEQGDTILLFVTRDQLTKIVDKSAPKKDEEKK
jgi:hypothetical protein